MKINGKSLLLALCLYLPIGIYAGSGDVNGDKKLTYPDVEAIISYIMGNNPENFDAEAANVNDDDAINIADVVALMNKIKVTISMNGQTQKGNNSNGHLTTHGYITDFKPAELPPHDLSPLFCVLHLTIDVPQGDYKAIILQTDNKLTTEATLSLTTGELTPTTTSAVQALTLKNVQLSEGQNTLEAYLSILPCDLSTSQLSIKVYDAEGNLYNVSGNFGGKTFEAGTTYHLTGSVSSSAIAESTGLPVVLVNTPGRVNITSKDNWLEKSTLTIINTDGKVINSPGKVKGRGNNTWALPKKPYAIKFSKKQGPFGFPANKDWILLAEYYDRTLLRTTFMSAVSKAAGIEFSINYQHVNLYLNGQFMGVYVLTDKIEESNNRVKVEKDGFIIEDDTYYKHEKVYFTSSLLKQTNGEADGFSFKYPDDDGDITTGDDNYNFIKNYIYQMESALNQLTSNPDNTNYQDYVDVTSFVKFHVACAAFVLLDPNRFYVLPSRSSKLKMMPMWDAEWSLGLRHKSWGKTYPMYNDTSWDRYFYFKYLMKSPAFVAAVKEEWAKFKAKKQQILDEVNTVRQQISTAQADNFKMWSDNRQWLSFSFDTWEEEVNNILQFFNERLEWLDEHYASMK